MVTHFDAGYLEMVTQMFPPIPFPEFIPNFTGYDLDSINWYETYEALAQSPEETIRRVQTNDL